MVDHNLTRVSDATAVTLREIFKLIKTLIFCQETSSESSLLHKFFIYSRAFNKY